MTITNGISVLTCWGSSLIRYWANFCSWSRLRRDRYSDRGALRHTRCGKCILKRHKAITWEHHVTVWSQVQLQDVMRPLSKVTATLKVPLLWQIPWGWWTVALRWKPASEKRCYCTIHSKVSYMYHLFCTTHHTIVYGLLYMYLSKPYRRLLASYFTKVFSKVI